MRKPRTLGRLQTVNTPRRTSSMEFQPWAKPLKIVKLNIAWGMLLTRSHSAVSEFADKNIVLEEFLELSWVAGWASELDESWML